MTERRCPGCRGWYDKKMGPCPSCSYPPDEYNPHLYTTKLNDQLYRQAESAEREKKMYRALKAGYDIPPTRSQQKLARQIVADM